MFSQFGDPNKMLSYSTSPMSGINLQNLELFGPANLLFPKSHIPFRSSADRFKLPVPLLVPG